MFQTGMFLLLIGALIVYFTVPLSKIFKINTIKSIIILKVIGLAIAILGTILLFLDDIPDKLQFLRIF